MWANAIGNWKRERPAAVTAVSYSKHCDVNQELDSDPDRGDPVQTPSPAESFDWLKTVVVLLAGTSTSDKTSKE